MTLRVEWTPETGADEPEVRTRDQNCTLNELKDWAIREFRMREVRETPEYIVISVDSVADETESVVAVSSTGNRTSVNRVFVLCCGN
jgi:hypothetical protein